MDAIASKELHAKKEPSDIEIAITSAQSPGSLSPSSDGGDEDQQHDVDTSDGDSIDESIILDALDLAEDRPFYADLVEGDEVKACSIEEAKELTKRLRNVGSQQFLAETLLNGTYSLRHLVTAFGVRPDLLFPDEWYLRILKLSIERELRRRQKLNELNTIEDAVKLLEKSKHVMVITGAGISTSLGIPDFRSKNTGFYSKLQEKGFTEPEEVFDIHLFDEDPTIFYSLAKEILPVTDRCSVTHAFIKLVQDQGKLLTNYTQNIDNIEQFAGIEADKLIQCHGSWATAKCRKCEQTYDGKTIFQHVKTMRVPKCPACEKQLQVPLVKKRKRGSASSSRSRKAGRSDDDDDDSDYDIPEPGVLKPGITFFHERLPNTFFDRLTDHDRSLVDLVIVIGTSMKVSPVSEIPNFIAGEIPQIYISREPAKHINFDIQLLGYCDDVVSELTRRAGWRIGHEGFEPEATAQVHKYNEEAEHLWSVTVPGTAHTAEESAGGESAAVASAGGIGTSD